MPIRQHEIVEEWENWTVDDGPLDNQDPDEVPQGYFHDPETGRMTSLAMHFVPWGYNSSLATGVMRATNAAVPVYGTHGWVAPHDGVVCMVGGYHDRSNGELHTVILNVEGSLHFFPGVLHHGPGTVITSFDFPGAGTCDIEFNAGDRLTIGIAVADPVGTPHLWFAVRWAL